MPESPRLLTLTTERVERELRAAESAAFWADEARRPWLRRLRFAAEFWCNGLLVVGWSAHTDTLELGAIAFWAGLLLSYSGAFYFIACGCLSDSE